MTEVQLPVKFIFVLIGPGTEEYFEIGRALSTLFSTSVNKYLFRCTSVRCLLLCFI